MEIIRRRRKSPDTFRLVERRLEISRPETMRQKFDIKAQRQIRVPSRPNKRSREEIAEIDGELLSRANRFGGGYQPLDDRIAEEEVLDNNNNNQQPEIIEEENEPESEGEILMRPKDNFPRIVKSNCRLPKVQPIFRKSPLYLLSHGSGPKKFFFFPRYMQYWERL